MLRLIPSFTSLIEDSRQKEAFAMVSKGFFLTRIMMNMTNLKEMHPILLFLFLPVNIRSPKS